MASKELFGSAKAAGLAMNRAGGAAYVLSPKEQLAQYAVTGMFGNTFYASAKEQVDECKALAEQCDPMFVAKCAAYGRQRGGLKDTPAFLLAMLMARPTDKFDSAGSRAAFRAAFPHVVDNGKMLRNLAQIVRSGVTGRKNWGHGPRRMMQHWLEDKLRHNQVGLFRDQVGEKPSLADVIKMVRPRPNGDSESAYLSYLIGKPIQDETAHLLPTIVKHYESFKSFKNDPHTRELAEAGGIDVPPVDFRQLDSLGLTTKEWRQVALTAGWTMLRMNLNTFKRHGVFDDPETVGLVATRLMDDEQIQRARVFPYQLLAAHRAAVGGMPLEIQAALSYAMEISTANNVPSFPDKHVVVCPDVSGSMRYPITGQRGTATTSMRYVDVAAIVASVIMRRADRATVLPFDTNCYRSAAPIDTPILAFADALAKFGGGGTQCELPLQYLNQALYGRQLDTVDVVIYVSDNESWAGRPRYGDTGMMDEWRRLTMACPHAKLVCIDIAAGTSTQAPSGADRLNIGGFSDAVWPVINRFVMGDGRNFVDEIEAYAL